MKEGEEDNSVVFFLKDDISANNMRGICHALYDALRVCSAI
jgi:hypothetical protein